MQLSSRTTTKWTITAYLLLLGSTLVHTASGELIFRPLDGVTTKEKNPASLTNSEMSTCYIVQLDDKPMIAHDETKPDKNRRLNLDSPIVKDYAAYLESKQDETLAAMGAEKIYSYKYSFNGFAAMMTKAEAKTMADANNVVNVWKDEKRKVNTDTSPVFLGLTERGESWSNGYVGEDVVIGILDTGVNPEHPSFADMKTPEGGNRGRKIPYSAPPDWWTGTDCDFGNQEFNDDDAIAYCNKKLLSAKCYVAGFSESVDPNLPCGGDGANLAPEEFLSARDADDHGSHVASTAGGNYGVEAVLNGDTVGSISGIAPRARIAVYKVCWTSSTSASDPGPGGCYTIDMLAAIDQAVADGVDVINFSIGGGASINDPVDIAFLFAAAAGVFVAQSNGNDGPGLGTTIAAPWTTSVGATTDNGVLGVAVAVNMPESVAASYPGLIADSPVQFADVGPITGEIVPSDPIDACSPLQSSSLVNKVALVIRGNCIFSVKFDNAAAAGAMAIAIYNDGMTPARINPFVITAPNTTIPGCGIGFDDGDLLKTTADNGETVLGTISTIPIANRIAPFSSRGPNIAAPDIIKPDIVAPGVSILAAGTPFVVGGPDDGENFVTLSGTSMSSPHVAGVFALLKQAHPDWSPAIAKSALMTTARQNIEIYPTGEPIDPFDIGSGHIVPDDAFNPGLAFNAGYNDYAAFSCGNAPIFSQEKCDSLSGLGFSFDGSDLNYPSIGIGSFIRAQTVFRTVTSVADTNGHETFTVSVKAPPGVDVEVTPSTITLGRGENATYEVTLTSTNKDFSPDQWVFGSMIWSNGGSKKNKGKKGRNLSSSVRKSKEGKGGKKLKKKARSGGYSVRSPIAVNIMSFSSPSEVSGSGDSGSLTFDIQFGYAGIYTAGTHGLAKAVTTTDTVLSGESVSIKASFNRDTAFARFALFDEYTSGNDDLDLTVFVCDENIDPLACSQVGASESPISDEQVDVPFPKASQDKFFYIAQVRGFSTEGKGSTFDLFQWDFGIEDDSGNMVVTAPLEAPSEGDGTPVSVSVTWPKGSESLEIDTKYLGAVSHTGPSGLIGLTLVDISTEALTHQD